MLHEHLEAGQPVAQPRIPGFWTVVNSDGARGRPAKVCQRRGRAGHRRAGRAGQQPLHVLPGAKLALAAFYTGRQDEAAKLWKGLLAGPHLPAADRARIEAHLGFALNK